MLTRSVIICHKDTIKHVYRVTIVVTLSKLSVARRDRCRAPWSRLFPACRLLACLWLIAAAAGCARDVWPVGRSGRPRAARRGGLQVNAVVPKRVSGRRPTAATGEDRVRARPAAEEASSRRRARGRSTSRSGVRVSRLQIRRLFDWYRTGACHQPERHFSHTSLQGKPRLYFVIYTI